MFKGANSCRPVSDPVALPEEEVGEAAAASAAGPVRGREGREEGAGPHTANKYEFEHKVYLKCVTLTVWLIRLATRAFWSASSLLELRDLCVFGL